jgi:hypothetical protein
MARGVFGLRPMRKGEAEASPFDAERDSYAENAQYSVDGSRLGNGEP